MDSILIFPPGPSVAGSQLQLGTYLMWDPGADYGAAGLIQSIESTNALRDGGVFAYRSVGPRKMSFPLLLRDVPGQTLLQTETLLREWTAANAKVAIQPETVPSGQAVFFDVIDGRWEPAYDGFYNRAGRRKGTLYLDTQPWGYWPTEILLASAASIGYLGQMPVSGASVLGDAPPLAHISIAPTVASNYLATYGTGVIYQPDMLGVSLSARPSFTPLMQAAQWKAPTLSGVGILIVPSLAGDKYAPASQALLLTQASAANTLGWQQLAWTASVVPSALEPAYRGRYRAFAALKVAPSGQTGQFILDVAGGPASVGPALASSNQLATVMTDPLYSASPGYGFYDMGELTLPLAGSGVQQPLRLRLWGNLSNQLSAQTWFGGVYLLPVDGAAGILTRGMIVPTNSMSNTLLHMTPTQAAVEFNPNANEGVYLTPQFYSAAAGPAPPYMDGRPYYRGVPLRLGASTSQLLLVTGDRTMGNVAASGITAAQANLEYAQVSVSYRPAFQFLSGGI